MIAWGPLGCLLTRLRAVRTAATTWLKLGVRDVDWV